MAETAKQRFTRRVEMPDGEEGCWVWPLEAQPSGQSPTMRVGTGRNGGPAQVAVHRWAWLEYRGDITEGKVLHQVCDPGDIICVNPFHFEAITRSAAAGTRSAKSLSGWRKEALKPATGAGEDLQSCPHHWIIEPPNGPTSSGVCKHCGERRDNFSNTGLDYIKRKKLTMALGQGIT